MAELKKEVLESVVLIADTESKNFGTGFIIHHDTTHSFILTCAHVYNDVNGNEEFYVGSKRAELVASGEEQGTDLAVVKIKRIRRPTLKLVSIKKAPPYLQVTGYSTHIRAKKLRAATYLRGKLGKFICIEGDKKERKQAWAIEIDDEDALEEGYSGSPVTNIKSDVFSVMIYRKGQEKGYAISITHLPEIWPDMPKPLQERFLTGRI